MSRDELIEIDGAIEARTDQAVLFHTGDKSQAVWLPRSRIQIDDTGFPEIFTVTMPEWMAVDRGLI
jgi:hypothetical protein